MIIVKITILLWILFFVMRFIVGASLDYKRKLQLKYTGSFDLRIIDYIFVLNVVLMIIGTIASTIYLLFIR